MGVEQNSPIRTPGVPNTAVDDATTRSHDAASWQPAADAGPRAAALLLTDRLGRALNITQGAGSQILTAPQPEGWTEVGGRVHLER